MCVLAKNDAKKPIFASHKRGVIVCYFGYVIFSIYFKIVWKRNHTQKNSFCNYFVEHLKNGIIFEEGGGRGRERELLWSGWGGVGCFLL